MKVRPSARCVTRPFLSSMMRIKVCTVLKCNSPLGARRWWTSRTLTACSLIDEIGGQIRRNTTARHVPARIVQVSDIPRTKSGKIVELAVRDVVHGRPVKNREALANPEALDQFVNRVELQS